MPQNLSVKYLRIQYWYLSKFTPVKNLPYLLVGMDSIDNLNDYYKVRILLFQLYFYRKLTTNISKYHIAQFIDKENIYGADKIFEENLRLLAKHQICQYFNYCVTIQ